MEPRDRSRHAPPCGSARRWGVEDRRVGAAGGDLAGRFGCGNWSVQQTALVRAACASLRSTRRVAPTIPRVSRNQSLHLPVFARIVGTPHRDWVWLNVLSFAAASVLPCAAAFSYHVR